MKRASAFCVVALSACAQLTGVADLSVDDGARPVPTSRSDSGPPPTEDAAQTDAPVVVPDAATNPPPVDAGNDAIAPCTALPTNDTFPAAIAAPWVLLGDALAANPGARLTPSAMGTTGALYWDSASMFDRFDIAFAYVITTDAASTAYGPGDGLAFAWISSAAVPALGATGGGLALGGLPGWAVAVDAYQNTENTDPATPNISIKNTLDMTTVAATATNAALLDGNQHVVRVRLANGAVRVSLDGAEVIGPTALPGYVPFSGYWGFGAGCGGAFEDHKITSVSARIGTTGACAAP